MRREKGRDEWEWSFFPRSREVLMNVEEEKEQLCNASACVLNVPQLPHSSLFATGHTMLLQTSQTALSTIRIASRQAPALAWCTMTRVSAWKTETGVSS
jgi:hypothetical protein